MIITTIQELRLASPAHALDSIDGLVGFIDNSEHDFLEDKLGTPLYDALQKWYDDNQVSRSSVSDYQTGYYNRLLLLAQRCVAFDALGRSAGMQGVSVNNAGINQMVTDDYHKADEKAIATYRDTCTKEAHAALNQLLRQLEQWCKATDEDQERIAIVDFWKESRYYYLAAALLIPSCEVLQSYLNIYDSREKFIQLLPDLQFIQEEIIGNSIGEDLLKVVIDFARDGKLPESEESAETTSSLFHLPSSILTEPTLQRLVHRLRKVMVALLVGRTSVLKYTKEQKIQAHDDGVRMLQNVTEYLKSLVPPEPAEDHGGQDHRGQVRGSELKPCTCPHGPSSADKHSAALWTEPLL